MKINMIRMIGLVILFFIIAVYPFAMSEGASKRESEKVTGKEHPDVSTFPFDFFLLWIFKAGFPANFRLDRLSEQRAYPLLQISEKLHLLDRCSPSLRARRRERYSPLIDKFS